MPGVADVEAFNEEEVVLLTDMGVIVLSGEGLHIVKLNLDEGVLAVEGARHRPGVCAGRKAREEGPVLRLVQVIGSEDGKAEREKGGWRLLFETLGQARVFLLMAAVGAAISLLYDVLCLVKGAFGRRGGWISEAMFACAAAVLLFLGMARVQVPTLRPYVLLGTAVGWFLYAVSVSRALHWAGEKLGGFWKKRAKGKG